VFDIDKATVVMASLRCAPARARNTTRATHAPLSTTTLTRVCLLRARVLAWRREEHEKRFPPAMELPFDLPKTWPGMQLVLQRCSNPLP
jgi:hypothetical protein